MNKKKRIVYIFVHFRLFSWSERVSIISNEKRKENDELGKAKVFVGAGTEKAGDRKGKIIEVDRISTDSIANHCFSYY